MKALVQIESGVVVNVILALDDATPESLGLSGTWVSAQDGEAGIGFIYDAETGAFLPPFDDESPENA
jgi:hypothetical protein